MKTEIVSFVTFIKFYWILRVNTKTKTEMIAVNIKNDHSPLQCHWKMYFLILWLTDFYNY